ncbi:MAG: PDZ domain-containing protein, partial [Thermoanaerobaculia bacterium]
MSKRFIAVLLLVAVHAFAQPSTSAPPPGRIDAVLDVLGKKFMHEVERTALEERALRLLLQDLDPYSNFLNAEEWAVYQSGFTGAFGGVGVTLGYPDGATVPEVGLMFIGSAAAAAGVRRGDSILAIDGRQLAGLPFESVISHLRGEPGSVVELTLRRAG